MKMNISIGVLRDHIAPICCGPNTTFRRRRHRRMGRVEHHEHGCDVLQSHKDGRRRKRVEHLGCTKYVERVREHVASMMPSRRSTPLEYHLRGESCAPRDNNASQSLSYRRAERCSPGGRRGGGGVWEGARRAADPRDRRVGSGSPRSPACSFGRRAPHRTQKHQSKTQRGVPGRRRGTSRSERERVPWGTTWRGGGKGDRKRGGRGGRGRGPPARPPRPLPARAMGATMQITALPVDLISHIARFLTMCRHIFAFADSCALFRRSVTHQLWTEAVQFALPTGDTRTRVTLERLRRPSDFPERVARSLYRQPSSDCTIGAFVAILDDDVQALASYVRWAPRLLYAPDNTCVYIFTAQLCCRDRHGRPIEYEKIGLMISDGRKLSFPSRYGFLVYQRIDGLQRMRPIAAREMIEIVSRIRAPCVANHPLWRCPKRLSRLIAGADSPS